MKSENNSKIFSTKILTNRTFKYGTWVNVLRFHWVLVFVSVSHPLTQTNIIN